MRDTDLFKQNQSDPYGGRRGYHFRLRVRRDVERSDDDLSLELLRSLESLLLSLTCSFPSTDFSLLCDRDLDALESLSREPRFDDDDDFSSLLLLLPSFLPSCIRLL